MPGATAIVHSPLLASPVSQQGGAAISQVTWVFADSSAAAKAYAGLMSERGNACVRDALIGQLKRQGLAVKPSVRHEAVLSHTRSYRKLYFSLRVSYATLGPGEAYVNLFQRRHHRAVTSLLVFSAYSAVRPSDLQRFSRRVLRRFVAGASVKHLARG